MTLQPDTLAVFVQAGFEYGMMIIAREYRDRAIKALRSADPKAPDIIAEAQREADVWDDILAIPKQVAAYAETINPAAAQKF